MHRTMDAAATSGTLQAFTNFSSRTLSLHLGRLPNKLLADLGSELIRVVILEARTGTVELVGRRLEQLHLYFNRLRDSTVDEKVAVHRGLVNLLIGHVISVQSDERSEKDFAYASPTADALACDVLDALLIPIISDDIYGLGFKVLGVIHSDNHNDTEIMFSPHWLFNKYYKGYGWQRH